MLEIDTVKRAIEADFEFERVDAISDAYRDTIDILTSPNPEWSEIDQASINLALLKQEDSFILSLLVRNAPRYKDEGSVVVGYYDGVWQLQSILKEYVLVDNRGANIV